MGISNNYIFAPLLFHIAIRAPKWSCVAKLNTYTSIYISPYKYTWYIYDARLEFVDTHFKILKKIDSMIKLRSYLIDNHLLNFYHNRTYFLFN